MVFVSRSFRFGRLAAVVAVLVTEKVPDAPEPGAVNVTTTPETGKTVLFEGVVAAERDFGSGYKYDVILETARVVSD